MSLALLAKQLSDAGTPIEGIILALEAVEARDREAAEKRAQTAERKRRQRDRERDGHVTVTGHDEDIPNPPSLDKEIPPRPPKEIKPIPSPNSARARKGFRLPEDFEPHIVGQTAEMVKLWPPGRLEREIAQFRDYFAKTGGEKGLSLDWQASLRNWLRNADDRMPRNGRISQSQSPGIGRTAAAALDVFGYSPERH